MKFSVNVAQYFSDEVDYKNIDHDELIQKMGLQLGAIEDYENYASHYEGVCVVRIVTAEKHPNADKLHVCRIDDGGINQHVERDNDGLVQVVCGAPNVRNGMIAAWIPPHATVPSTVGKDPFVLEARELRGIVSNGMLASPKELDVSDEHDGILEILPEDIGREPIPGEPLSNLYGLDDYVITCENKMFTHRPDCFGNLGIAREVAGIFGNAFSSPDWYEKKPVFGASNDLQLSVKNSIPKLVPRFMSVAMSNIMIGKSPIWMQAYLRRVGIKPINNVVDVTNYVMHLTGQPTHAFDYDKLLKYSSEPSLFPRMSVKGEKIQLLGGKEIELTGEEMVISTDQKAVALAGIMGGADTEVDENTKTIVIECATFDMFNVRRTSMRFGLFTEAVTRFNKGQSPLQNDRVLWYVMKNMQELAEANQASDVYDVRSFEKQIYEDQTLSTALIVHPDFINERLGIDIPTEETIQLLSNVEFIVDQNVDGTIKITAPFWRTDIELAEDVVEEVGRLYGYNRLPVILPSRIAKPVMGNAGMNYTNNLRHVLRRAGANEVLTYSFVHGDLLKHMGIDANQWAYHIRNAISPELQYYRPTVLPSLLTKVHANSKAQAGSEHNEFSLFEVGKGHIKGEFESDEPQLPKQMRHLAFVFSADSKAQMKYSGSPYYYAKQYIDLITGNKAEYLALDTNKYPLTAPFQQGRSAVVMLHDNMVGVVGEFRHSVKKALKLPDFCAGFELDIDHLRASGTEKQYRPLSNFPSISQDITLEVRESVTWQDLNTLVEAELRVAQAELGYDCTVDTIDIYQNSGGNLTRYTFRITVTHHHKTLKTEEVSSLLDQLSKVAYEMHEAKRI